MLKEMNRLWKLADRRTGMKILICDDELLAAEKIADLVSHFAAATPFGSIRCKIHRR